MGAEFALAAVGAILGRAIGYFDALLADRFTRHVSIRVMEHASRLDLASYEDPVFYDKLERARVQATDRIAMIQALGAVLQQIMAAVSLSLGIVWFSPWLLVVLVLAVVPAFLGESHFAFLGYAQNIRQTPVKRQLDYLRMLGASKESAKELKLFALSGFLSGEYTRLADQIYEQNVRLARRRLWAARLLSLLSTARILRGLRLRGLPHRHGRAQHGDRCNSWLGLSPAPATTSRAFSRLFLASPISPCS